MHAIHWLRLVWLPRTKYMFPMSLVLSLRISHGKAVALMISSHCKLFYQTNIEKRSQGVASIVTNVNMKQTKSDRKIIIFVLQILFIWNSNTQLYVCDRRYSHRTIANYEMRLFEWLLEIENCSCCELYEFYEVIVLETHAVRVCEWV